MAATVSTTGVNPGNGATSTPYTRADASTMDRTQPLDDGTMIFASVSVAADGDTWSTGLTNIYRMAFRGGLVTPHFASAADQAIGKITFASPAGAQAGYMVLWRS